MMWVDIREPGTNKLLLRFDAKRGIIEVKRRGRITLIDLRKYTACVEQPNNPAGCSDAKEGKSN